MLSSYRDEDKLLLAVDGIIFGFGEEELKILLIKRDLEPKKGAWSLIGGFLKKEETLDEAATRVLHSLTGIKDVYMEALSAFDAVDRDPEERTISIAYYTLINIAEHNEALIEQYSAQWFSVKEAPSLIFDHDQMVQAAIDRLRYRASTKPIGFELLPEKFTMRQLQKLYEAIWDKTLDKRNFINKFRSFDILIKLDEKDKASSRKGSWLYRFDQEKYEQKVAEGFMFKL